MNGADRDPEALCEVLCGNEALLQEPVAATLESIGTSNADDLLGVERLVSSVAVAQCVECIGGLLIGVSLQQSIERSNDFGLRLANDRHGNGSRYRK